MKGFLKHLVIFFFGLIVFMALIDAGTTGGEKSKETSSGILDFEHAVSNGEIVVDGTLGSEDEVTLVPSVVGEQAGKVGNGLVGALSSFLELIGETVYHFFA